MGKANLHPNPLSGYSEDYPDDEDVELGEDDFDEPDARCAPIAETTCSALIGTSRKALSGSARSSAKAASTSAARTTMTPPRDRRVVRKGVWGEQTSVQTRVSWSGDLLSRPAALLLPALSVPQPDALVLHTRELEPVSSVHPTVRG